LASAGIFEKPIEFQFVKHEKLWLLTLRGFRAPD